MGVWLDVSSPVILSIGSRLGLRRQTTDDRRQTSYHPWPYLWTDIQHHRPQLHRRSARFSVRRRRRSAISCTSPMACALSATLADSSLQEHLTNPQLPASINSHHYPSLDLPVVLCCLFVYQSPLNHDHVWCVVAKLLSDTPLPHSSTTKFPICLPCWAAA